MKHQYRCDSCGCYLDPGEGLLCDECRYRVRSRIKKMDNYNLAFIESQDGQYQMKLQEVM